MVVHARRAFSRMCDESAAHRRKMRKGGPPERASLPEVGVTQWNESPQAQLPCAFGLSIVNPCFWMVSSKSIVEPSR